MSEPIAPTPGPPRREGADQIRAPSPRPYVEIGRDDGLFEEPATGVQPVGSASLVGVDAHEKRLPPLGAVLLLVGGFILLFLGVAVSSRGAIAMSIVAICCGATLLLLRTRPLRVVFGAEGLSLSTRREAIPYVDITEVFTSAGSGADRIAVHLSLDGDQVTLPSNLSQDGGDIAAFLRQVSGADRRARPVPRDLQRFREVQEKLFPADEVRVYGARPVKACERGTLRPAVFCLGLIPAGVAWIVGERWLGATWIGPGIGLIVGGAICALLFWLAARFASMTIRQRDSACIVLSPGGLALVQDSLRGELKWLEVVGLKLHARRTLLIQVAGAQILVADVYEDATNLMLRRMKRHWQRVHQRAKEERQPWA